MRSVVIEVVFDPLPPESFNTEVHSIPLTILSRKASGYTVARIEAEELRRCMKKMKSGKACGPSRLAIELFTAAGDRGVEL